MLQNETVYINIYVKLKNTFSNSNRYFAVLLYMCAYIYRDIYRDIYIIYIYYIYYVHIIYIILYIIYVYIYIYIYHQDFPCWGIGGNPPTSQKIAHSPRT